MLALLSTLTFMYSFSWKIATLNCSFSLETTSSSDPYKLRQLDISPLPIHLIIFPYKMNIKWIKYILIYRLKLILNEMKYVKLL